MTHSELVELSYRWLLKNGKVGFAFKELRSVSEETPDVIGFDSWQSIMIECKVSRSDFFCDKNKPHRKKGMGNWRFYSCPKGMIKKDELPPKWGLIYVDEKGKSRIEYDCRVKKVKRECSSKYDFEQHPEGFYYITMADEANWFDADIISERRIMYTCIRRLFIKGYVKYIYDKQYNKNTTPNELILLNNENL